MHTQQRLRVPEVQSASVSPAAAVDIDGPPLRIALLGYRSHPFGGGQGVYLRYLSQALMELGHAVDVISGPPYPQLVPGVRLIKLPSLDLFENGLGSLRPRHLKSLTNIIEWTSKLTGGFAEPYCFGRRAVKYLRHHGRQYDIIHDNQSLAWGMLELQRMGFPLITTIHHPITSDLQIALAAASSPWQRLLIRRWHHFVQMQREVAKQLRHVVTVSECSRRDIATAFGLQEAALSVVPCGIDLDTFRPMPGRTRHSQRLIATVSADQPLKGLHYLLQAMAQLRPRYPQLSLLLVGQPQPGGATEQLMDQLGLRDCIECVRGISTEELVGYYAEATLAVVPSVYEGFGLPAAEAMACGIPLVTTTGGALPEVVGDAALSVPVRDSEALAAAISQLLDSPAERALLGAAGRERMERMFCWRRSAERMVALYREVLRHADR